jgi:hypothetical protein
VLSLPLHTLRMLSLCSFQSPEETGSMYILVQISQMIKP